MFQESLSTINREYELDYVDQVECSLVAEKEVYERLSLYGAYHIWETGYCQGDASEDDVEIDCENAGVETLDDLLDLMERIYLEVYLVEAKKIEH